MNRSMIMPLSVILICFSQALWGSVVEVFPEAPVKGNPVTISYNANGEGSRFESPVAMALYALMWDGETAPVLQKLDMAENNGLWSIEFVPAAGVVAVQFKFVLGEQQDDYNGTFWDFMLHDGDGNPLPGAGFALGKSWVYRRVLPERVTRTEMIRPLNIERGAEYFLNEYRTFPNDTRSAYHYILCLRWRMDQVANRQQLVNEAMNFAETLAANYPDDPYVKGALAFVEQQLGNRVRGDELGMKLVETHAAHPVAESFRAWWVTYPPDGATPQNRAREAMLFLQDFPGTTRTTAMDVLLPALVALEKFDEAHTWLKKYGHTTSLMYQYLANQMLLYDHYPAAAVECMESALQLWKEHPGGKRPTYLSEREWNSDPYAERHRNQEIELYMDYALSLVAAGRANEAIGPAQIAYDLDAEIADANLELVANYINVLRNAGMAREAIETGLTTILSDNWNDPLIAALKKAYIAHHGQADGFNETIQEHQAIALDNRYILRMIDEYAPDFTLNRHGGGSMNLRELKGKVVVLDFWALWCGPCLRVFPHFQKAVEHYVDNPDVIFIAINTMERVEGEELISRVDNFLDEHGYTFEVVYDYDRRAVANKYDISAIPTRITIGPDNRIKYRDRGSGGAEVTASMISQIDLLLESLD